MHHYVIRRLLMAVPTLLLVVLGTFVLMRVAPGDAIEIALNQTAEGAGVTAASKEAIDRLRAELGLGEPIYVQFGRYVANLAHGDFGRSFHTGRSTWDQFWRSGKVTFELSLLAFILSVLIGVPIGVLSAIKQDTLRDYLGRITAVAGISIPDFWLGTMAVVFPGIWWVYQAPLGYRELWLDPLANLQQFIIPIAVLGFRGAASDMRLTRSQMLEVLRHDYVRTARAKGLAERAVIIRHALRNAVLPVVTLWGASIARILGGTVVIEQILSLPGVGTLTLSAINNRDYPQIQTNVLILAAFVIFGNLLTDVSYVVIDPRVRYR